MLQDYYPAAKVGVVSPKGTLAATLFDTDGHLEP